MAEESRTRRLLRRLHLDRVDLVPAGANPEAHVAMFKHPTLKVAGRGFPASDFAYVPDARKPETWRFLLTSEPGGKPDAEVVMEAANTLEKSAGTIPEKDMSDVTRNLRVAWVRAHPGRSRDELPDVLKEATLTDTKTAEELQTELDKATAEKAEAEQRAKDAEAKLAESPSGELEQAKERLAELEAELEKSDDTDVRKRLEKAEAETAKLRKEARERVFVEKAKELGAPESFAPVLDEIDEKLSPESQDQIAKLLKANTEQIKKGELFRQLSDPDHQVDESAEVALEKAARERMAKTEGLTIEQAKVQVMEADPDLHRKYAEEQRS